MEGEGGQRRISQAKTTVSDLNTPHTHTHTHIHTTTSDPHASVAPAATSATASATETGTLRVGGIQMKQTETGKKTGENRQTKNLESHPCAVLSETETGMGWLRLVGPLKS